MTSDLVSEDKIKELRNKYFGGELIDFLTSPTPEEFTDYRSVGGGKKVKYIFGHYFIQKLNDAFGFLWSLDVPEWHQNDKHLTAKVVLSVTVPGRTIKEYENGHLVREITYDQIEIRKTQFGGQEVKYYSDKSRGMLDFANDLKGAVTDGMKKCGTMLGIGLDIYGSRIESEEKEGVRKEQIDALFRWGEQYMKWDEVKTKEWAEKELGKKPENAEVLELMGLRAKLMNLQKEHI